MAMDIRLFLKKSDYSPAAEGGLMQLIPYH